MPDININGFNFVTQAGTTEPQITNNVVFPAHHIIKIQQNHVDVPISLPDVSAYSQAEVTNMRTDFAVGSGNKVLI